MQAQDSAVYASAEQRVSRLALTKQRAAAVAGPLKTAGVAAAAAAGTPATAASAAVRHVVHGYCRAVEARSTTAEELRHGVAGQVLEKAAGHTENP